MTPARFLLTVCLISIAAALPLLPQSAPGNAEARAIEVPVRVFRDGRPVTDLKSGDFTVYINGKIQSEIRMVQSPSSMRRQRGGPETPCTHIFVFHLFHVSSPDRRRMNDILHLLVEPGDRLWYLLPTRTVLVDRIGSSEEAALITEAILPEELETAAAQTESERDNLNQFMDRLREQSFRVVDRNGPIDDGEYTGIHLHYYMKALKSSLETYLGMKRNYEKQYLFPGGERIQSLLTHAAPGSAVHLFYQPPVLPELSRHNRRMIRHWIKELGDSDWYDEREYAQLIYQILGEIDSGFSGKAADGPEPPVSPFVEAGIPLFPILIKPAVSGAETGSQPGWWPELVETWGRAARLSGGRCTALIESTADIRDQGRGLNSHYLLRLNLAENQPLRSLRIEVEDRSARVFHPAAGAVARGDRPTATTNPPVAVRIEQAVFHDRELTLALGSGGDGGGPVLVRIRVNDSTGRRIFDQSKSLTPRGDRVRARIRFTRLPHGSYTFLIEAGRAATTFGTLRVIRGVIAP